MSSTRGNEPFRGHAKGWLLLSYTLTPIADTSPGSAYSGLEVGQRTPYISHGTNAICWKLPGGLIAKPMIRCSVVSCNSCTTWPVMESIATTRLRWLALVAAARSENIRITLKMDWCPILTPKCERRFSLIGRGSTCCSLIERRGRSSSNASRGRQLPTISGNYAPGPRRRRGCSAPRHGIISLRCPVYLKVLVQRKGRSSGLGGGCRRIGQFEHTAARLPMGRGQAPAVAGRLLPAVRRQ